MECILFITCKGDRLAAHQCSAPARRDNRQHSPFCKQKFGSRCAALFHRGVKETTIACRTRHTAPPRTTTHAQHSQRADVQSAARNEGRMYPTSTARQCQGKSAAAGAFERAGIVTHQHLREIDIRRQRWYTCVDNDSISRGGAGGGAQPTTTARVEQRHARHVGNTGRLTKVGLWRRFPIASHAHCPGLGQNLLPPNRL